MGTSSGENYRGGSHNGCLLCCLKVTEKVIERVIEKGDRESCTGCLRIRKLHKFAENPQNYLSAGRSGVRS